MIFELYGIVRHKGRKIANGIDGRFETTDERVIARLKMLGFKEIKDEPKEPEPKPTRKLGRPKTKEPR